MKYIVWFAQEELCIDESKNLIPLIKPVFQKQDHGICKFNFTYCVNLYKVSNKVKSEQYIVHSIKENAEIKHLVSPVYLLWIDSVWLNLSRLAITIECL